MSDLPEIQFESLFEVDPVGQKLWKYHLGEKKYKEFLPRYQKMGRNAALATPLARDADRNPPQLKDNKISFHPSYQKLKELSYGAEILSLKNDPDFLKDHHAYRHRIGFSIAYYFAQTETGLFCPICMTDALGRVLELECQDMPLAQQALKHIYAKDLSQLWEGSMFLTEKQGGSDVGANRVQATQKDGKWFLTGEKWFCSNATAETSLVLARMPEENSKPVAGTKGLGLFLLLRNTPKDNHKKWAFKRLKDKLGVKSMASAEIDFFEAEATLIGGVNEGFKIMTEMVNMSRLYNSVASIAVSRRSLLEASEFGKQREAFGYKLKDLPLWRTSLADLSAETFGMIVFVFEAIKQLDLADGGDKAAAELLRVMTPIAKGLSGKLAVFAAREAMEMVGGNAYIEDHILPRLLRDALVLPIWEGTTNIQSLDLLRALKKEGADSIFKRVDQALAQAGSSEFKNQLTMRVDQLKKNLGAEPNPLELILQVGRVLTLALLFELSAQPELKEMAEAAFARIFARADMFQSLGTGEKTKASCEEALLKI